MSRDKDKAQCPKSVTGHSDGGTTDGTCTWCGAQVYARRPRPTVPKGHKTDLGEAYGQHYDPDHNA